MLNENLENLASCLQRQTEDGLASLLDPWLGQHGVRLVEPAICQVSQKVRIAFSSALTGVLIPEMQRLLSVGLISPSQKEEDRLALLRSVSLSLAPPTPDYTSVGGATDFVAPASTASSPYSSKRQSLSWPTQDPMSSRTSFEQNAYLSVDLSEDHSSGAGGREDARHPARHTSLDLSYAGPFGNYTSLSSICAPSPSTNEAAQQHSPASYHSLGDAGMLLRYGSQSPTSLSSPLQDQQDMLLTTTSSERRSPSHEFRGLIIASSPTKSQQHVSGSSCLEPLHVPPTQQRSDVPDRSREQSSPPTTALQQQQQDIMQQLMMSMPGSSSNNSTSLTSQGHQDMMMAIQQNLREYSLSSHSHSTAGAGPGLLHETTAFGSPAHPHQGLIPAADSSSRHRGSSQGASNVFRSLPSTPAPRQPPTDSLKDMFSQGFVPSENNVSASTANTNTSNSNSLLSVALNQVSMNAQQQQQQQQGILPRRSLPDSFNSPFGHIPPPPPPHHHHQVQHSHHHHEVATHHRYHQGTLSSSSSPRALTTTSNNTSRHMSHPSCSDWLSMSTPAGTDIMDFQAIHGSNSFPQSGLPSIPSRHDLELLLGLQAAGGSGGSAASSGASLLFGGANTTTGNPTSYQHLSQGGSPNQQHQILSELMGESCGRLDLSMGGYFTAGAALAAAAAAAGMGTEVLPPRFKVLPLMVQQRILGLTTSSCVISIKDFDDKVVSKMTQLVDNYGVDEALAMLTHLEHRMRTKQGVMKNGPGYLDVAVSSHLDMLKVMDIIMSILWSLLGRRQHDRFKEKVMVPGPDN
ncbi:hypothetical protein CEUSTIGMA_g6451.t1 [Chlamydomonas eustigma]|uniref:Uncharacterized protein n=1 Tax=Chlamydomonas eustigma TaxID=1157962 RepID=A0A250X7E5_9CHLO|nr:hypothetical protein CEUSTIGMA_g6451.t1 [Chlamydomonas eustigma]|eukprot:GAX79011.1 hypothetical protein CEUSTIGMA_g6451.t1 [Chlamydomonas eustigma]